MPLPSDLREKLKAKEQGQTNAATTPEPPRPLLRQLPAGEEFPVDSLGPVLSGAAWALRESIQAPLAMCAQSVLAGACLAVQALADIEVDGRTIPLSCFFETIGESGERKSSVDSEVLREHRAYQSELEADYRREWLRYENSDLAYKKAREEALKKAKGYVEKQDALTALGPPHEPPRLPRLLASEPTFEGLFKLLQNGRPSVGIFNDEAGTFIGGHGLSDENRLKMAAGLSSLWDGKPLDRVRGGDGASSLRGRRVCSHLMAQPGVAAKLFADSLMVEQGLVSRFLPCFPTTTRGTRLYNGANLSTDGRMTAYHARIRDLLHRPARTMGDDEAALDPPALSLDPAAKKMWVQFHDLIESQSGASGELERIRGFANKTPEHALRLAGTLATFDAPYARTIDVEHVAAGIELAQFYVSEALRLFDAGVCDPKLELAGKVLAWVQCFEFVYLAQIYQFGPYGVRDAATARDIAGILSAHGWFIPVENGMVLDGAHRRAVWGVVKCS